MPPAFKRLVLTEEDHAATPLELFFDLVFVFALAQVTTFMAHDLGWLSVGQGLLILSLFWWGWVGIAWLSNLVRVDEGPIRLIMLAAMGVLFLVGLAIPQAFHATHGAVSGPYLIAAAYLAFRLTHALLFWVYASGDRGLRRQLLRFFPTLIVSSACLFAAAATHDVAWQTGWWVAALVADYLGTLLGGAQGWRLRSAAHFAERHGLIVIIALGESIVAIGVGAAGLPISGPVITAGLAGMAIAAAFWWIYFDMTALKGEQALAEVIRSGGSVAMARDAYSILHLPLLAGIVLVALGLKKALAYVGDGHHAAEPLGTVAAALFGGVILYLAGQVGFKLRTLGAFGWPRAVLMAAVVVLWVVTAGSPALVQVVVLAIALWLLVAFETVHYAGERAHLRAHG